MSDEVSLAVPCGARDMSYLKRRDIAVIYDMDQGVWHKASVEGMIEGLVYLSKPGIDGYVKMPFQSALMLSVHDARILGAVKAHYRDTPFDDIVTPVRQRECREKVEKFVGWVEAAMQAHPELTTSLDHYLLTLLDFLIDQKLGQSAAIAT